MPKKSESSETEKCPNPECDNGTLWKLYVVNGIKTRRCPICKGTGLAQDEEISIASVHYGYVKGINTPASEPVSEKTLKWRPTGDQNRAEALDFEYIVQWEDNGDQRHAHAYLIKPHPTSTLDGTFGSYPTIERAKQVCQIHADAVEAVASHARKEALRDILHILENESFATMKANLFITSELEKGTG